MNSKYENMKIIYNRSKIGWYWAPLFLAFWFLLYYLVVMPSFHRMPPLKTLEDELREPGQFIGERAENTLLKLSKIGPKVVGSAANEQVAVQLLLSEITEIIDGARTDLYDIEKDVQIASGNYLLWSMVNVYQSVQNVVVRVSPRNATTEAALLINSHFDSVPGSSGAGDSGVMCVVMLEVLRVITKYETPLTNTLIFLFNGAEENPLQGSHAFITQHPWKDNVRLVRVIFMKLTTYIYNCTFIYSYQRCGQLGFSWQWRTRNSISVRTGSSLANEGTVEYSIYINDPYLFKI